MKQDTTEYSIDHEKIFLNEEEQFSSNKFEILMKWTYSQKTTTNQKDHKKKQSILLRKLKAKLKNCSQVASMANSN